MGGDLPAAEQQPKGHRHTPQAGDHQPPVVEEQAQGDEREVEPAGEEVAEHAHVGVGDHLAAQEILLGNGPEDDAEHDGRAREPELGEHEHEDPEDEHEDHVFIAVLHAI